MTMKGLGLNAMSNLTSTVSSETSISSNTRNESTTTTTTTMLYPQASTSSFAYQVEPPPDKKRRSLPGNPDPESEVIALSPKSLLATNRFICEICNKGFQRDQNLQLHRRGHNLPWKLKQRAKDQIIRKKVYVCPEPNCVHHDPSRALGDLTGIKKHYCRKHGEKKWKCDKCSRKYAVQSDWKAHSKICGTREYRCDCGTLYSRRDSFITHRAFCDTLAEENAGGGINPLITRLSVPRALQPLPLKREHDIPPWLACTPPPPPQQPPLLHHHHQAGPGNPPAAPSQMDADHVFSFEAQYNPCPIIDNAGPTSFEVPPPPPQLSATVLLQKAAEMGVAVNNQHQVFSPHGVMEVNNNNNNNPQVTHTHMMSISVGLSSSCDHHPYHYDPHHYDHHQSVLTNTLGAQSSMMHDMIINMSSMQSTRFGDFHQHHQQGMAAPPLDGGEGGGGGGSCDGLTRDFLGPITFSHKDFHNMAGLGEHVTNSSASFDQQQHDHHHQN